MELILRQDVENVGFKDDVVTVKNGYGRNFLIPQGYAVLATSSAKKVLAENLKQRAFKEAKMIDLKLLPPKYLVMVSIDKSTDNIPANIFTDPTVAIANGLLSSGTKESIAKLAVPVNVDKIITGIVNA